MWFYRNFRLIHSTENSQEARTKGQMILSEGDADGGEAEETLKNLAKP